MKRLSNWLHKPTTKKHLLFILILLLFAIFNFRNELMHPNYIRVWKDVHGLYYYGFEVVRDSILNYHQFPHWSVYIYGGFPFFAYPQSIVLYINTLLLVLFPFLSVETIITLFQILSLFLSGLIMYIVLNKLDFKPRVAFIGGQLHMFSWYLKSASYSWLGRYSSMLLMPIVFYCVWKALYTKEWAKYGLLGGFFFGLEFLAGGIDMFMYTFVVFIAVALVYLIPNSLVRRGVKTVMVFALLAIVTLLVIMVQLLPIMEFSKISSQRPFTFEESVGDHVTFSHWYDIFNMFIGKQAPGLNIYDSAYIGWIGFALVILGLIVAWKRRLYWFSVILMILALLTVTGSRFYYVLWKFVPGFDRMHHVDRGLFLFTFASVMMAVLGFAWLDQRLKTKNIVRAVYLLVIALITWQLVLPYFELEPPENFHAMLEENQLLQYLSKQPGLFRIHNFNTLSIAGHGSSYTTPYRLQMLYGVTSVWIPEFFNVYLGLTHASPAKFYGMLNTKYLYANDTLNVTGLTFYQKFEKCTICVEDEGVDKSVSGPYLYENEEFLPRAYFTKHAALITGHEEQKEKPFHISLMSSQIQFMYQLMLDPRFEPVDLVIIADDKETLTLHDEDDLSRYDAILLVKQPSPDDIALLQKYISTNGYLIPNILAGKSTLTDDDISYFFNISQKKAKQAEALSYTFYSPNKQTVSLNGEQGWIVLAEKYHMFEGWRAKVDGKKTKLYKANGVQTALYAPAGSKTLELYYSSWRFHVGLASFILVLTAIGFYFWKQAPRTDTPTNVAKDQPDSH